MEYRIRCLLRLHPFDLWRVVVEVPLWRKQAFSNTTYWAAGNQPTKEQLYATKDGTIKIKRIETDVDFLLVGKLIEQQRQCTSCGLTQKKWRKVII